MLSNKHEVPKEDRLKRDKRFPLIPDAENYKSKQDGYSVEQSGPERQNVGYGDPQFNVGSCKLKKRGMKNE